MRYILLSAQTNSEWDNCEFALVELTKEREDYYKSMIALATELNEKHGIDVLEIYCDEASFFADMEDIPNKPNPIGYDSSVSGVIIDIDDSDVESMETPDQDIRCGSMRFSKYGVKFKGYGKHTGEEFYTDNFNFQN